MEQKRGYNCLIAADEDVRHLLNLAEFLLSAAADCLCVQIMLTYKDSESVVFF